MTLHKKINYFQEKAFDIFVYISYFLIIVSALGVSTTAPEFLRTMDYYVRIYVCLFLIWRFNPFRKIEFTELDRKIAFSAGLFILTTTTINNYLLQIREKTISFINNKNK
jgi:hypothetical protein